MSEQKVARLGDPTDHGGQVIQASENVEANKKGVARVGDLVSCPLHGPNPILTGSSSVEVNSKKTARVTSVTQCGSKIIDGSPDTFAGD